MEPYCKEEITNVVRDIHCNAHVCKVKSVTQPDQRKRDDMMSN